MTKTLRALAALIVLIPLAAAAQGVRPAVFAGQFYEADPARLAAEIDGYLAAAAPASPPAGRIAGLIVPHAGYVYSGRTAAAAYALLRGRAIDTVVIVGPTHRFAFEGVSIWPDGGFETPLGVARVDAALAKEIAKAMGARFRPEAFAEEHSVEVQVPFVQRALARGGHRAHRHGRSNAFDHPVPGRGPGQGVPGQERRGRRLDRPVPFPGRGRGPGHRRAHRRPGRGHGHRRAHPQGRGPGEHHVRRRTGRVRSADGRQGRPGPGRDPGPNGLLPLRGACRRLPRRGRIRRGRTGRGGIHADGRREKGPPEAGPDGRDGVPRRRASRSTIFPERNRSAPPAARS